MWFSLSEQTAYFLRSPLAGAFAAVLYDLLRAERMFFKAGRVRVLIGDILFFAVCGVLTSLFALPFNKGDVRAFIVFGEALGFLCWRFTVGQVSGRFYSILSKQIRRIFKKICELLKKFFDLLLKIASRVVYNVGVSIDKLKRSSSDRRKKKEKCRTVRKECRKMRSGKKRRVGRENRKRNGYEKRHRKKIQDPYKSGKLRRG